MARRNNFDPDEVLDPDDLEEKLEEEGNDGILKDGQSVRAALYMKDGSINPRLTATQRGKAAQQTEDAIARRFGLSDVCNCTDQGFAVSPTLPHWHGCSRPIRPTMPPTRRPTSMANQAMRAEYRTAARTRPCSIARRQPTQSTIATWPMPGASASSSSVRCMAEAAQCAGGREQQHTARSC